MGMHLKCPCCFLRYIAESERSCDHVVVFCNQAMLIRHVQILQVQNATCVLKQLLKKLSPSLIFISSLEGGLWHFINSFPMTDLWTIKQKWGKWFPPPPLLLCYCMICPILVSWPCAEIYTGPALWNTQRGFVCISILYRRFCNSCSEEGSIGAEQEDGKT